MAKLRKKVLKDNPGKRLKKTKKTLVRDALALSRDKVMVYTDLGYINIARTLESLFHLKGIKCTESRCVTVCQRLKRKTVELSNDCKHITDLHRFVH